MHVRKYVYMYECMYECIYVYMYVYINIYTYTCVYVARVAMPVGLELFSLASFSDSNLQ